MPPLSAPSRSWLSRPPAPWFAWRRWRLLLIAGGLALSGLVAWDLAHWARYRPPASTTAQAKPLQPFEVDPSWVRSGEPNFRATVYSVSPDQRTMTGVWACDGPSSFEWHFSLDETVHVLEGRVDIDYQGRHFTLLPGDTAHFRAGTTAVWQVPQHLKKSFTLYKPGQLAHWLSRLF